MAFKLAGSQALKQGAGRPSGAAGAHRQRARADARDLHRRPRLSDLNGKRAHVLGISPEEHGTVIDAQAPLAEMQRYATDLRSLTQGRATSRCSFDHYAEVPEHIAKKVIEAAEKAKAEAAHSAGAKFKLNSRDARRGCVFGADQKGLD